jgi:GTPase SAR1 family protein
MLVGNKLDIVQENNERREVPLEAAQQFAKEENLMFVETSATNCFNVREAFEKLLQEIFN